MDCRNVAMTGMSFGGYTGAALLELQDPRIRAAVLQCPSIHRSDLATPQRQNRKTPVMVMLGAEDTVIGDVGNIAARAYVDTHKDGPAYLVEVVRGGHVSLTSCEIYNAEYGNGIGNRCPSLTNPGKNYQPLDIVKQHAMINTYGLAFLNVHLKPAGREGEDDVANAKLLDAIITNGPFPKEELIARSKKN